MTGIKLKDLSYGALNEIADLKQSQLTGDPRRTSTSTSLQRGAKQAYEPDTLEDRSEFNGFIVSYRSVTFPVYQNKASMLLEYTQGSTEDNSVQQAHVAYKVYIPELEPRPAPKGNKDPILRTYPDVYTEMPGAQVIPLGSMVLVRYENPATLSNPKIVKVLARDLQIENLSVDSTGKRLIEGFSGTTPTNLGSLSTGGGAGGGGDKANNLTFTLKEGLPVGTVNDRVEGEHINTEGQESLRTIVENELAFWSGKNENTSQETNDRIQLYQDYVFMEYHGKPRQAVKGSDGKYYHWSAIYISWIVSRITPFPAYAHHTGYAGGAKDGKHGWTLWMTETAGTGEGADPEGRKALHKIQANIGDTLVKPPVGRWGKKTNSHGDTVYKIENGKAWLTGGNLGAPGTAKGNFSVPVDANGNYSGYAGTSQSNPYQIILKYKGKLVTGAGT